MRLRSQGSSSHERRVHAGITVPTAGNGLSHTLPYVERVLAWAGNAIPDSGDVLGKLHARHVYGPESFGRVCLAGPHTHVCRFLDKVHAAILATDGHGRANAVHGRALLP